METTRGPRDALVSMMTPEQRNLYFDNPWFRNGIEQLAVMLSFFIAGLAGQAEERQSEADKAVRAMRMLPHMKTEADMRRILEIEP